MTWPQEGKRAALAGGIDNIDALPDVILQHILSFLPAKHAMRTCVLARRWRDLWKTAKGLRITGDEDESGPITPVQELREFVDHLLLLRGRAPIDTCKFSFHVCLDDEVPRVNLWMRHVILCQVRLLHVHVAISRDIRPSGLYFCVHDLPLVSRHLTRLELTDTGLNDSFLDFAGCPMLEDLVIFNGHFTGCKKISSKSLKHLSISYGSFDSHTRTRICVPRLISLRLEENWDRTPVLESMPLLMAAFVRFYSCSDDRCSYSDSWDCHNEDCEGCYDIHNDNCDDDMNSCVLLEGLSKAEKLVLIDKHDTFIFRRDLTWCPTFSKLKTLLLNECWCVPSDFKALACILKHSPVLEILTLHLFSEGPEHQVEIRGSYHAMQSSAALSKHLKVSR